MLSQLTSRNYNKILRLFLNIFIKDAYALGAAYLQSTKQKMYKRDVYFVSTFTIELMFQKVFPVLPLPMILPLFEPTYTDSVAHLCTYLVLCSFRLSTKLQTPIEIRVTLIHPGSPAMTSAQQVCNYRIFDLIICYPEINNDNMYLIPRIITPLSLK